MDTFRSLSRGLGCGAKQQEVVSICVMSPAVSRAASGRDDRSAPGCESISAERCACLFCNNLGLSGRALRPAYPLDMRSTFLHRGRLRESSWPFPESRKLRFLGLQLCRARRASNVLNVNGSMRYLGRWAHLSRLFQSNPQPKKRKTIEMKRYIMMTNLHVVGPGI